MKTASNELQSFLLTSKEFLIAEIYTITLLDGTVLRYTSRDQDISYNGNNYSSNGLLLKRGRTTQVLGLEVDELELSAMPVSANIGNASFLTACRQGALDGATVKLERLFYDSSWNSAPVGALSWFTGDVSDMDLSRSMATIRVKSMLEKLNVQWPRMVYQAGCVWKLYDAGCGANKNAFTVTGAVTGGNNTVIQTNLAQANNYFNLGVISFTSGNAAGSRRTIKSFAAGNVTVIHPLISAVAAGDTFTIYPGCQHSKNDCISKFINTANFHIHQQITERRIVDANGVVEPLTYANEWANAISVIDAAGSAYNLVTGNNVPDGFQYRVDNGVYTLGVHQTNPDMAWYLWVDVTYEYDAGNSVSPVFRGFPYIPTPETGV